MTDAKKKVEAALQAETEVKAEAAQVEEPKQAAEPKTCIPTKEQLDAVRPHIYNTVIIEYRKFGDMIKSLPFAPENFLQGLSFLDTGMLWIKEAINYGQFRDKLQLTTGENSVKIEPIQEVAPEDNGATFDDCVADAQ